MGTKGLDIQVPVDLTDNIVLRRVLTEIISVISIAHKEDEIVNLIEDPDVFKTPKYYKKLVEPTKDTELVVKHYVDNLIAEVLIEPEPDITDLNQNITDPPTQSEVQAISDKIDEILEVLRETKIIEI